MNNNLEIKFNISKDICLHMENQAIRETLEDILMDGVKNFIKHPLLDYIKERQKSKENYWIDGQDEDLNINLKITFTNNQPELI